MHLTYSSSSLVEVGKGQGVAILLRDVTEQVSSMDTLREWAEQQRSVIQASPDGILVTDAYGYVTMANTRAVTLFGVGLPDDLVGKRVVDLVAQELRSVLEGRA